MKRLYLRIYKTSYMKLILIIFLILLESMHTEAQNKVNLYFENNSTILSGENKLKIDSLLGTVKTRIVSATVTGHCDSIGTEEYNQKLSEARAKSVSDYIKSKKVVCDSIITEGKGEKQPWRHGKESYLNRRTEIEIVVAAEKPVQEKLREQSQLEKDIEKATIGDLITLKNIEFYGGMDIPLPESAQPLYDLLMTMRNNPTLVISIEGHICCSASDEENLSERRAKAIYDYLVAKGIGTERLSYIGYGHSKPLTMERDEDERRANRRVEIRVIRK